jgi:hypothetical protein
VGAVHPGTHFFRQAFKKGPFHSQKQGPGYMKQLSSQIARTSSDSFVATCDGSLDALCTDSNGVRVLLGLCS